MPPKAKGKKAARKMPPPLPKGEILTDGIRKQEWVIGSSIGKGGCGEIYTVTQKGRDLKNAEHVIKIEPNENGPLFSELSYYRRVAKEDAIKQWVISKELKYLPIPKYVTSGNHEFGDLKYRFMVMQRFGTDIEKHFRAASKFCEDTVNYLALRLLEGLEFLHESEYVHADIKGSNLLTGLGRDADRVYLVDYGLAFRFNPENVHKEYKEDPRRAHDGTVEFTSIDAHNGVSPSRRGDLEILGYCLLQWACGKLPWENNLTDKIYVASKKKGYKGNADKLVRDCFGSGTTGGSRALQKYMAEVYKLDYTDNPQYSKLRKIFEDQLHGRDPRKTLEWMTPAKPKPIKRLSEEGPSVPPILKRRKQSPIALDLPTKLDSMHKPPSSDGSDQVDLGGKGKKPKGKKTRLDAKTPVVDRLPQVVYPPELGYACSNDREKPVKNLAVKGRGSDERVKENRGRSKQGNPPPTAKGKQKEDVVTRRSQRNRGKVVNYADPSTSLNDSQGATVSHQESSDEEDQRERVGNKRGALKTADRKRKRRRT